MNPSSKQPGKTPKREKTTLSSNSGSREKLKDPVHVYCRLRPLKDDRESTCIKVVTPTQLCLSTPAESRQVRKDLYYEFKHIFTAHADQKEIFDHVAYPLIEDLLHAKNGLLFTYGVTGSGKTYTLTGEPNNPGIMPRSIHTIFNSIQEFQAGKFVIKSDHMNGFEVQSESDALQDRFVEVKSSSRGNTLGRKGSGDAAKIYANDGTRVLGLNETNLYSVFVNYIEIYNNIVYDLLDESGGKTLQSKILREDASKNMYVSGVVEIEVKSAAEAFEIFNMGQRRKRMGHTTLNAESSRSHSIFNIRVVQLEQVAFNGDQRPAIPEQNMIKVGQLSLVDLAGSERCSRTQNTGLRLKEASSINNSLMSLRTCLEILRENQLSGTNRLVPYRDSRLTLFFKNYFEGHGRIEMIVCVNPSVQDFEENLQVVKFAELTQDVKVSKPEVRYTPCKKVVKKLPVTPLPTPKKLASTPSFSLPKIPSVHLNFDDPEACTQEILKVIKILRMRKEKAKTVNKEIANKEQRFRKRLVEINQENMLSKSEIRSLKTVLKKERQKVENLDTKISDLEMTNNNQLAKQRELEDVIRNLRNTIDEKDMRINQNILEREKFKQKQAREAEKLSQELEIKLKKQRQHLQAEMLAKENKLQKMREVLESNLYEPHTHLQVELEEETPVREEPKTPEKENINRRSLQNSATRRRRSRSAGEIWLEHNVIKPVPLGTVMQPTMKKRKSITKLSKAKDVTNPKQNKYCLVAQEPDSEGELETKLYKADIVPTCGGGAQVIFNDVERLRQQSPTAD